MFWVVRCLGEKSMLGRDGGYAQLTGWDRIRVVTLNDPEPNLQGHKHGKHVFFIHCPVLYTHSCSDVGFFTHKQNREALSFQLTCSLSRLSENSALQHSQKICTLRKILTNYRAVWTAGRTYWGEDRKTCRGSVSMLLSCQTTSEQERSCRIQNRCWIVFSKSCLVG